MNFKKIYATKNVVITLLLAGCLVSVDGNAKKKDIKNDVYRRNSLCTYFISDFDLLVSESGVEDEIRSFLDNYEVSDKYDDHTIGDRYVNVSYITYTDADRSAVDADFLKSQKKSFLDKAIGFLDNTFKDNADYQATKKKDQEDFKRAEEADFQSAHPEIFTANSMDEYEENIKVEAAKIYRYLIDSKFANQLVAKWFNAKDKKEDGSHYDLSLIQERGLYDASKLDVMKAAESTRRWAVLQDAGMELISHTFVSFTHFEIIDGRKYKERSHASSAGKRASKLVGGLFGSSKEEMDEMHENEASETAGYYITSTTHIFQLEWNKELEEKFINEYWEADLSKLMNSSDFKIKYLGYEQESVKTMQDVLGKGLFKQLGNKFKEIVSNPFKSNEETRSEHESQRADLTLEMTEQSLIRSIDATYAAIQKDYDDFKVMAPLIDVDKDEATAFIGLKEGVTGKSQFEVYERVYNEKTCAFEYKKVGKLSVDKDRIWDNRYTLIDDGANVIGKGDKAITLDRTYLKGKTSDLAPGMLLRQIK